MPRAQKPHHPVTVRLEQGVYEKLNQFCEDSGQPKTVAIERALAMYIKDYYDKQAKLEKLDKK